MNIETKGWSAHVNLMPGSPSLRVSATVTVPHPGITPSLSIRPIQDKSFALALDLNLNTEDGMFLQVLTEKSVLFELPGDHGNIPRVDIFHDGKLLTSISEMMITH